MAKYILSYIGGNQPQTPEEGQKHFAEYQKWLQSLGDSAISPMNPFKNTHSVAPDGLVKNESTTMMSGYTIIQSENIDEAIKIAQSCPFLSIDGTLEVSELVEMGG